MPDELQMQTDTTAEGGSVDASTSADEGSSAPLMNAAYENDDEKKGRISQKKWQEMVEKTKKAEERDAKILEALGVKPEEGQEIDAVTLLTKTVADLKADGLKKEFEAKVPVVRNEKYADAWNKINKAKAHLVQSGELTHEDLWKMIRDEGEYKTQVKSVQETQNQEQEAFSGSIPFFSNSASSASSDKLSAQDKQIAREMGWTEKTYQAAGVL